MNKNGNSDVRAGRFPVSGRSSIAPAALDACHLKKSYGATKALADLSFSVEAGTAHALLGENGAGKSTTIKMLSGLVRPDGGRLRIFGEDVVFREPRDAHRHGLQTAFQELTLASDLTVLQNMVLAYEPTRLGRQLDGRAARQAVSEHLERLDLAHVDLRSEVRDLDLNLRQRLEIARALFRKPRILLLDEATSSLSGRDIEWLTGIIGQAKAEGITIVMITHKLPEVRAYCEYVTVLRNGRDVGTFEIGAIGDDDLVELIIGRSLQATFPPRQERLSAGAPVLGVRQLAAEHRLLDCSFDLHAGEILGVAGLQGMGQVELFKALFGAVPYAGAIEIGGRPACLGSPRQAIDAGVALIPEERKTEGLFLELTGRTNVAMPSLKHLTRCGLIDKAREADVVAARMRQVQVDLRALYTNAGAFSGGNQQKILLAKWLLTMPSILLLFDPCRGVDVGTKHEIYLLLAEYAAAGGGVLLYSSETPELVNLCHRVLVLYGGRVAETLSNRDGDISETSIMRATLGGQHVHG